jgi:hypothetical protein
MNESTAVADSQYVSAEPEEIRAKEEALQDILAELSLSERLGGASVALRFALLLAALAGSGLGFVVLLMGVKTSEAGAASAGLMMIVAAMALFAVAVVIEIHSDRGAKLLAAAEKCRLELKKLKRSPRPARLLAGDRRLA